MSKATASPTARLLQHSRLFSLPRPLPQPALETLTSTGTYRASDTATLPYPTHQAIVTPPSSHHRGDWGLKRALPKKSTQSSTPHVRVLRQDTWEHITDFSSAGDHTQTRAKWLEMGVPVWYKQPKSGSSQGKGPRAASVFDDTPTNPTEAAAATRPRWQSGNSGPWLAGMQDGEFERFMRELGAKRGASGERDAKGRSKVEEFREYLKDRIAEQELSEARREAQETGDMLSPARLAELRQELRPDESELDRRLKELRDRHASDGLSSELTAHISSFLDLPAIHLSNSPSTSSSADFAKTPMLRSVLGGIDDDNASAADSLAPPSTHPSAGLSYTRTNAIMSNHPLHGPQSHRSPVLARVLRTRTSATGTEYQAKLGVGGFVANDPVSGSYDPGRNARSNGALSDVGGYNPDKMAHQLDTELEGGNKMWVHPNYGWVDEKGRVRLEVTRGDKEAVAVKEDAVDAIHDARASSTRVPNDMMMGAAARAPAGTAGNANFGRGLPDTRRMSDQQQQNARKPDYSATRLGGRDRATPQRRPEVRGFTDEELGGGAGKGNGEESAASRIRDILGQSSERWR